MENNFINFGNVFLNSSFISSAFIIKWKLNSIISGVTYNLCSSVGKSNNYFIKIKGNAISVSNYIFVTGISHGNTGQGILLWRLSLDFNYSQSIETNEGYIM